MNALLGRFYSTQGGGTRDVCATLATSMLTSPDHMGKVGFSEQLITIKPGVAASTIGPIVGLESGCPLDVTGVHQDGGSAREAAFVALRWNRMAPTPPRPTKIIH